MAAAAPARNTGLQVTATVTAGGKAIDTDRIVSIETWTSANRIPRARVTLFDGEADTGRFPFSESDDFLPGKALVLSAGYGSDAATIHTGVIVRHGVRVAPGAPAQLVVESADKLIKMTLARGGAVSPQTSDADLISALVAASGGSVGTNSAGSTPQEAIVQAHASDWDLMLLRAEASGCVAIVDAGSVDIVSPLAGGSPVLMLGYGDSIIAFDADIDATHQLADGAVTSEAWSYADQAVSTATAGAASVGVPGNLSATTLAEVFGINPLTQRNGAAMAEGALTDWSTARLMRHRLAQLRGTVKFQGSALVKPGNHVTLAGLGARFEGDAFVGGVRHAIRDGNWLTTIDLGMAMDSFSRDDEIADPAAAGLIAPLRGLHSGKVIQVAEDPNGDYRVQVKLPLFDAENGVWARLGQFYASNGFGAGFFPEKDDEVVLGFMNEDPANPVILASVYSNQRAPTNPPTAENDVKALVTRSKMEVNFNDKDVVLKISTPGGRVVTLDDKAGAITIADKKGNTILMTDDKLDITSIAALNMSSKGAMTIDAGAGLTITAKTNCDISGATVSATGKSQLALESKGLASLKAAAILEVNGALVKIN